MEKISALYNIKINIQTILRASTNQEDKQSKRKKEVLNKHFIVKQVICKEDIQTANKHLKIDSLVHYELEKFNISTSPGVT